MAEKHPLRAAANVGRFGLLRSRYALIALLALLIVAALGFIALPMPVDADQALYLVYARMMAHGAALYRDVWDLKQPGIFLFYELAGRLLRFDEISAHALELAAMLGLSFALQLGTRGYVRPLLSALSPLPTVGLYYVIAGTHLTNVEGIVNIPLAGVMFAALQAVRRRQSMMLLFFCSGLAAGCVAALKLVYVLIPLGMWALCLLDGMRTGACVRQTVQGALAAFAGLAVPIVSIAVALTPATGFALLYATTFTDPMLVLALHQNAPVARLIATFRWFALNFAACLTLAGVPIVRLFFGSSDLLTRLLAAWLALGVAAIVSQRWSWWEHHPLLLVVPVGLLALKGLDEVVTGAATGHLSRRVFAAGCLIVVLLFIMRPIRLEAEHIATLASFGFGKTAADRNAFQLASSSVYREAYANTRFFDDLRNPARPGAIFVCGSAVEYLYAHRDQALSTDGYSPEFLVNQQWREFEQQLSTRLPPYVFIDAGCAALIAQKAPAAGLLLAHRYRPISAFWYERRK